MEPLNAALMHVFTAIGAVVAAGGGLSLIAYAIFRFLGERWLNNKFEERLSDYKHKHQKELEHLKHEISKLMDRATKLHQREFDVIPEAWGKMNDAYNKARSLTAVLQEYADVGGMSQVQLEEYLEENPLLNWQKAELKTIDGIERQRYYQKAISPHRVHQAWAACVDLNIYLRKNGIFMPPDILAKFEGITDVIFNAVAEYRNNEQLEIRPRERVAHKVLHEQCEQLIKDLQADVQGRLWGSMTTSAPA